VRDPPDHDTNERQGRPVSFSALISIVLVTTGRSSGEPREARLYAYPDGDGLIVVASDNGKAAEPHWAGNLRAAPRAQVRRGRSSKTETVRAHEVAEGPERDRLWAIAAGSFPHYKTMQRRSARRFAVFLLEPAHEDA
jgi:deazaflavin-dependent oxidoreductase (nitroreductase family)